MLFSNEGLRAGSAEETVPTVRSTLGSGRSSVDWQPAAVRRQTRKSTSQFGPFCQCPEMTTGAGIPRLRYAPITNRISPSHSLTTARMAVVMLSATTRVAKARSAIRKTAGFPRYVCIRLLLAVRRNVAGGPIAAPSLRSLQHRPSRWEFPLEPAWYFRANLLPGAQMLRTGVQMGNVGLLRFEGTSTGQDRRRRGERS